MLGYRELAVLKEDAEQSFQPDLFGRHGSCFATTAPPKTQVKTALALQRRGDIYES